MRWGSPSTHAVNTRAPLILPCPRTRPPGLAPAHLRHSTCSRGTLASPPSSNIYDSLVPRTTHHPQMLDRTLMGLLLRAASCPLPRDRPGRGRAAFLQAPPWIPSSCSTTSPLACRETPTSCPSLDNRACLAWSSMWNISSTAAGGEASLGQNSVLPVGDRGIG
jgi:hypothetical protein